MFNNLPLQTRDNLTLILLLLVCSCHLVPGRRVRSDELMIICSPGFLYLHHGDSCKDGSWPVAFHCDDKERPQRKPSCFLREDCNRQCSQPDDRHRQAQRKSTGNRSSPVTSSVSSLRREFNNAWNIFNFDIDHYEKRHSEAFNSVELTLMYTWRPDQ